MRTFHSGWVAQEGWDMTQGLARVEELFEARNPKAQAEIADIDWIVTIENTDKEIIVRITATDLTKEEYYFSDKYELAVKVGQEVKAKQIIARNKAEKQRLTTKFPWKVKKIENWVIVIEDIIPRSYEYKFELGKTLIVKDGDEVKAWDKLTPWAINIAKLMEVAWVVRAEQYIVDEIKAIYSSQGQTVNSKHIELVVRQMFSKVRILEKWDSEFFPWDIVDIIAYKKTQDKLLKEGKTPPFAERLLLWITKISLYTESWLSAASFQETVRVLVESWVSAKIDKLKELKENVIIGRLIPAGKQYRKLIWLEKQQDIEDDYFNVEEIEHDISNKKLEELNAELEHESDF
jgi:DNA-directed RNA polymerase subunit beta'